MVSEITTCIDTALDGLELIKQRTSGQDWNFIVPLMFRLRNLKTFVLCARKYSLNSRSLELFLVRIKVSIGKSAEIIHSQCHDMEADNPVLVNLRDDIQALEGKTKNWYVFALLDNTQKSIRLTTVEVLEVISSILENLMDFGDFSLAIKLYSGDSCGEEMEALKEQMAFLKSFATQTSIPLQEFFLAQFEIVALDVAYLIFECGVSEFDEKFSTEMKWSIYELVKKIKSIDPEAFEAYTQALLRSKLVRRSVSSSREMDDEALVSMKNLLNSLVSNLWQVLVLDTRVALMKDQLKELYEGLRSLRTILSLQQDKLDMKIQDDIGAVLCDARVIILSFFQKNIKVELGLQDLIQTINNTLAEVGEKVDLPHSSSKSFDSVSLAKADVLKTAYGEKLATEEEEEATNTYNEMPSQTTLAIINDFVGFHKEATSILERLTRGSRQLQLRIISIVGMAGSGKTTLATKVYNDTSIIYHFQVRAWSTISQTVNKKKVLTDLLNQIDPKSHSKMNQQGLAGTSEQDSAGMSEDDLVERLRRCLKKKRYLIFLDDIWDMEAWNRLTMDSHLFPDDGVGSRIILTSRHHDVAPRHLLDEEPHFVRQLDKEESLELLQKRLFPQSGWAPELLEHIAENCQGLPLTIVIVGGLLAATKPEAWKEILDYLSNGSVAERCEITLELSYKVLPSDLKSCLLYFGGFPEDQEISVRKLIRLWIAEGFVQRREMKSLEDVAEDYLKALIGRSLIMVAKQRSVGGVRACRIHDLLRDFCMRKAKNENFFRFLVGRDELFAFNEPCNLGRLCILSEVEHFQESELYCPRAQTLIFNHSFNSFIMTGEFYSNVNMSLILGFKFLKVLDLQQISLGSGFPREIALLVQLVFLAIKGRIMSIPSIPGLTNLETLILEIIQVGVTCWFSLPDDLWDLQKLQCLCMKTSSRNVYWARLPTNYLDRSSNLHELVEVSGATIPLSCMERILRKFPNVSRLKFAIVEDNEQGAKEEDTEDGVKIVVPDFLSRLESLHLKVPLGLPPRTLELSFPQTLKKLTLTSLALSLRNTSILGKLPILEVLKFEEVSFEDETLAMEQGEFWKLRVLKLSGVDLVRWTACDDQFECFQKLILHHVPGLKEIPCSCLETIPTLEMIDISLCYPNVVNMARQIEETQLDYGNSNLKIIVSNTQMEE